MRTAPLARALEAVMAQPAITRWDETPAAKALLASCAARPPKAEWHRTTYAITADEHLVYVGERAKRLRQIYDAHGKMVADHEDRTRDSAPFIAWAEGPDVDEAIGAACGHAPYAYRYASDAEYAASIDQQAQERRDSINGVIDLGMARLNAKQRQRWADEERAA